MGKLFPKKVETGDWGELRWQEVVEDVSLGLHEYKEEPSQESFIVRAEVSYRFSA